MLRNLLRVIYPALIFINKLTGSRRKVYSSSIPAKSSFYQLSMISSEGNVFEFSTLTGKKLLIVNSASRCGYTQQYEGLQELSSADVLTIIAFPSGDFAEQEMSSDGAIRNFCSYFHISFPLMQKSIVKKRPGQNDVFNWLTHAEKNGWNNQPPLWNFTKYLINESGNLIHIFESAIEPEEIKKYL